jgi:pimeloyl-ACP methyl ester carboxylesterase
LRYLTRRLQGRARSLHLRHLHHGGLSLRLELDSDSPAMLMTFGGLGRQGAQPSFEFAGVTSALPVKRAFVRDPYQTWYHRGLARRGASIEGTAEALAELTARHGVGRLVTAGNSAGGYAALLFGTLLGAAEVHAFAPQTVLDPAVLEEWADRRWEHLLRPLAARDGLEQRWVDLRRALPEARHGGTRYRVYFDETIRLDRLHAERLAGIEGLRLYRFGRGGHSLVRQLRDCGALERLLLAATHA